MTLTSSRSSRICAWRTCTIQNDPTVAALLMEKKNFSYDYHSNSVIQGINTDLLIDRALTNGNAGRDRVSLSFARAPTARRADCDEHPKASFLSIP